MAFTVTNINFAVRAYDTNSENYVMYDNVNYNQPNFSYIVELYECDEFQYLQRYLTTIKITPEYDGKGYYNPTGYISNYLSLPSLNNTPFWNDAGIDSTIFVKAFFSVEYGDPIVRYSGTSYHSYYYPGCQIYENYNTLYDDNYWVIPPFDGSMVSGYTNTHFLSPVQDFYLDQSEKLNLYFQCVDSDGNSNNINVIFNFYYNSNLVQTNNIGGVFGQDISPGIIYKLGAGPSNLFNNPSDWFSTGSTPTNWDYYTIKVIKHDVTGLTYISGYTIYNTPKCKYNDFSEVHWFNEHGGWSSFTFNKRKYNDYKITRNTYDALFPRGGNTSNRGLTQFNTEIEHIITLNTDWINDKQNLLIKSLMMSPDVRILENGIFSAYNIIDTEYSEKNKQDDGLYSYQIKLVKSNKKIIQNG